MAKKINAGKKTTPVSKPETKMTVAFLKREGEKLLDKKKKALLKSKAVYHKHARELIELWSKVRRAQRSV